MKLYESFMMLKQHYLLLELYNKKIISGCPFILIFHNFAHKTTRVYVDITGLLWNSALSRTFYKGSPTSEGHSYISETSYQPSLRTLSL